MNFKRFYLFSRTFFLNLNLIFIISTKLYMRINCIHEDSFKNCNIFQIKKKERFLSKIFLWFTKFNILI